MGLNQSVIFIVLICASGFAYELSLLLIQNRYHVLMAARLSVVTVVCYVGMNQVLSMLPLFSAHVCVAVLIFPILKTHCMHRPRCLLFVDHYIGCV